jgi:hypothetical protein
MYSSETIAMIAVLMHISAFLLYNKSTFQGKACPNIATWAIWAALSFLNFGSYFVMSGDWVKSILPAVSSLLCIATFFVVVFTGKFSRIGKYDLVALALGLIAALTWWWFRSATYANLLLQISIGIGFVPTCRSVWRSPETEVPLPWIMWATAYSIGTSMVLLRWHGQWQDLAYYVGCVVMHFIVWMLALRQSRIKKVLTVVTGALFVVGFLPRAGVAVSGVLCMIGFLPYIVAIVRGSTKPAKATWIIWASLDTITLCGMFAKEAVNGQILGAVVGAWTIAALSVKFGASGWTKLDKLCLAGAVLGVLLWQVFDNPLLGIVTSLSVVFLGSIPTFVSVWRDPSREDKFSWTIFWASCVVAVWAIPSWTIADAGQPLTFFTIEMVMMYILYFRHVSNPLHRE